MNDSRGLLDEVTEKDPRFYKVDLEKGVPFRKNIRLYKNKLLQFIARKMLLTPAIRIFLQKLRGVHFVDTRCVFLGEDVFIDEVFPELVSIGSNVLITEGVMIFTHLYDPSFSDHVMQIKPIRIEDNVFVGARSILMNGVTLGKGCVVGAGSVVTKDIPPGEIYAGVPAKQVSIRGSADGNNLRTSDALRD